MSITKPPTYGPIIRVVVLSRYLRQARYRCRMMDADILEEEDYLGIGQTITVRVPEDGYKQLYAGLATFAYMGQISTKGEKSNPFTKGDQP